MKFERSTMKRLFLILAASIGLALGGLIPTDAAKAQIGVGVGPVQVYAGPGYGYRGYRGYRGYAYRPYYRSYYRPYYSSYSYGYAPYSYGYPGYSYYGSPGYGYSGYYYGYPRTSYYYGPGVYVR